MGRDDIIQAILDALAEAEAASSHQSLRGLVGSAINAVRASSRRARLGEPKTSAAACLSVACGAMAPVAAACRTGEGIEPGIVPPLVSTIRLASSLLGPSEGRPCKSAPHDELPPVGWKGKRGGEFKRRAGDGEIFWIVRSPYLPGGDWSLYYGALSIGTSECPEGTSLLAASLERLLSQNVRMPELIPAS